MKGKIIKEFVGLRSKCYALRTKIDKNDDDDDDEKKKKEKKSVVKRAKGVKNSTLENQITFEDYHNCIKNNCSKLGEQYSIRSKKHELYTISMEKIALNPFDDKRYIIKPDGIETIAWGHYKLEKMET